MKKIKDIRDFEIEEDWSEDGLTCDCFIYFDEEFIKYVKIDREWGESVCSEDLGLYGIMMEYNRKLDEE